MKQIAMDVVEDLDKVTLSHAQNRQQEFKKYNRASSAGYVDDCLRCLVLMRTCPEKQEETSLELQRRFDEGHHQEKAIRAEMVEAGYEITPAKPMIDEGLQTKGEADDIVEKNDCGKRPADYKSASSGMFRQIVRAETAIDLMKSKQIWIRHYPAQMYLYMFLYGFTMGLFVFKNKDSGEKCAIDVPENPIYAKQLKDGLMTVNEYVAKEEVPRAIYCDACKSCGFFSTVCFEGESVPQDGVDRKLNPELEVLLDERRLAEPDHKRFVKVDKAIKDQLRGETVVIGDYFFKTTSHEAKAFDVPQEVKDKYQITVPRQRCTIKYLAKAL